MNLYTIYVVYCSATKGPPPSTVEVLIMAIEPIYAIKELENQSVGKVPFVTSPPPFRIHKAINHSSISKHISLQTNDVHTEFTPKIQTCDMYKCLSVIVLSSNKITR